MTARIGEIVIRNATDDDFDAIWEIMHAVLEDGRTYAYPPDTTRDEAYNFWMRGVHPYVAERDGVIVGTFFVKANQPGAGSHVANASYMVSPEHAGKGIGRIMGEHALEEAKRLGFTAMQFNFVVASNTAAIELWKKMGFKIVGTLPRAFNHPDQGFIDAYVMHRYL